VTIPIPSYISFDLPFCNDSGKKKNRFYSTAEIRLRFREFVTSLVDRGIFLYTDGSKGNDDSSDGAVFSSNLGIILKHKLPSATSVFSAEAWALYQLLIMFENSGERKLLFFLTSEELYAVMSFSIKSCDNYLIPLIRSKFHSLCASSLFIQLVLFN